MTVPQQMASCCGQGHTQTAGLLSHVWQRGTSAGTTSWHVVSQNLEHQSWWGTCVSVLIPFHRTKATPPVKKQKTNPHHTEATPPVKNTQITSVLSDKVNMLVLSFFKYYLQMFFTSFLCLLLLLLSVFFVFLSFFFFSSFLLTAALFSSLFSSLSFLFLKN